MFWIASFLFFFLVSVRLDTPIPKAYIFRVMTEIYTEVVAIITKNVIMARKTIYNNMIGEYVMKEKNVPFWEEAYQNMDSIAVAKIIQ